MILQKNIAKSLLIFAITIGFSGCSTEDSGDDTATGTTTTDTNTGTTDTTEKTDEQIELEENKTEAISQIENITGLSIASNIDLFGEGSSGASLRLLDSTCEVSSFEADSDFCLDKVSTYVNDDATRAIDMANKLQCFFLQAGAHEVAQNLAILNALGIDRSVLGDFFKEERYIAQVDMDKCFEQGQNSSNGQSSGDIKELVKLETFVKKNKDDEKLLATYIFDMYQDNGAVRLGAKQNISSGATEGNPLGIWDLTWVGHQYSGETLGDIAMKGFVKINQEDDTTLKLELVDETIGQDYSQSGIAMLSLGDDGIQSGYAKTSAMVWNDSTSQQEARTYTLNIQQDVALKNYTDANGTEGTAVCLDKDPDTREVSIWSYGLYDSTGSQVHRNGGFPVVKELDGKDRHGWAGYWGIWFDQDASLTDGDTLKRYSFDDEGVQSSVNYTYVEAPGKLIEHSKKTLTAEEFTGVDLNIWTDSGEIRVEYNGTEFVKTANRGSQGQWESVTEETYTFTDGETWAYSQSMGGQLNFTVTSNVPSSITYFNQKVVSNSLADTTLYCSFNCLNAGFSSSDNAYQDDPASGSYIEYTWDLDEMSLKLDSTAVAPAASADLGSQYSWGISTGYLRATNSGDSADDTIFYTWETGPNSYNKFSALKDADGSFVSFDAPLNMLYEHSQTNDYVGKASSDYYGLPIRLEYSSFGDLHGIPWDYDENTNRWAPAYSIKAGTTIGDYYVKPLEGEERLATAASGSCDSLSLADAAALTLPTNAAGWANPEVTMREVEPITLVTEGFIEPGACKILKKELVAAVQTAVDAGAALTINDFTNNGIPYGCKE